MMNYIQILGKKKTIERNWREVEKREQKKEIRDVPKVSIKSTEHAICITPPPRIRGLLVFNHQKSTMSSSQQLLKEAKDFYGSFTPLDLTPINGSIPTFTYKDIPQVLVCIHKLVIL
ncbi:hypothetical protein CANARDRAFT_192393 [[Candida] arabinofermentans NRRL YB-2248]|uniref:Uncharacterized protein n=1 Tax=[Candida] arabinofermentans NRRL YB-2248 TaxID=983967 RepID=A0A1E4SSY6_9ASCO|nr:hypothetical protein CANARDRAFT_192393 [[Candida] arabinofermentans NRRL YB-2248]